jgi:uracil phosphoribosyltransferase
MLGVEIARDLRTAKRTVTTVMGAEAVHEVVGEDPLIMPILRAGIPLGYGLHRVFPYADMGFIGAMRNEESETSEATIPPSPALPATSGKQASPAAPSNDLRREGS